MAHSWYLTAFIEKRQSLKDGIWEAHVEVWNSFK